MKRASCFLMALLFAVSTLLCPAAVWAAPSYYYLGVAIIQQPKTKWCWAASGASVVFHATQNPITPYDFSLAVKGNTTNNSSATLTEVKNGLNSFGVNGTILNSTLSFSSVKNQIGNSHRAIIVELKIYDYSGTYTGKHMVVIQGYDDGAYSQTVSIMDPQNPTGYRTVAYSTLVPGTTEQWYATIYNIY